MTCIAEKLLAAGYSTHMVGKWDVGIATPQHSPKGRGYETWYGFYGHSNEYWHATATMTSAFGAVDVCLNQMRDLSCTIRATAVLLSMSPCQLCAKAMMTRNRSRHVTNSTASKRGFWRSSGSMTQRSPCSCCMHSICFTLLCKCRGCGFDESMTLLDWQVAIRLIPKIDDCMLP